MDLLKLKEEIKNLEGIQKDLYRKYVMVEAVHDPSMSFIKDKGLKQKLVDMYSRSKSELLHFPKSCKTDFYKFKKISKDLKDARTALINYYKP